MQVKQAVVTMLRNYNFYICEKTEIPAKYHPDGFVQLPIKGVYLRLKKRRLI